ncbi:MAG: hypothetical protein RSD89_06035 [Mucinivorans sp.]
MKRNTLLLAGLLLSSSVVAQEVRITKSNIIENRGTVKVTFTADVAKLKSDQRLTITPVIYGSTGSQALQPIIITGRNRSISDQRLGANNAKAMRAKKNMQIPYTSAFAYEPWMSDLSLRVDRKVERCCTEKTLASLVVVDAKPIRYDVVIEPIQPIVQELSITQKLDLETPCLYTIDEYAALKENIDVLRAEGSLVINFRQNDTSIDPSLGDNQKTLDKIKQITHAIESDPQATLEKIVLAGASSPEGAAQKNDVLAQKRADALKKYLGINSTNKADLFDVVNVGEDWTGLRQMVEASDMQYKDLVLATMAKYTVRQGREVELMKLKWGRPYNYMLEHFFPKLRSAGYIRVFYDSAKSTDTEATNQAIKLYNDQAYADVLARLANVASTAVVENMRGVCHMMLGDYEASETALQKAISMGSTDAQKQLEQLHKLQRIKK